MPELPDIANYLASLEPRIDGRRLEGIRLGNPFVLRSVSPSPEELVGRRVTGLRRLGKRVVIGLEQQSFLVIHLMIAGRLRFRDRGAALARKVGSAAFDFDSGTLLMTEAGSKKRASLHIIDGEEALSAHDPGGLEPLGAELATFATRLTSRRHTLKRSLTDPRIFSGIGNAYSDEILHRARLSPFLMSDRLSTDQLGALHAAVQEVLEEWIERLRNETGDGFPEKVTAFRPEMAVHGKFGSPCPVCGAPVQRIVYTGNESNYCATCQTGGKLLADRALSRLLKRDWPRTVDELERLKRDRS